MIADLEPAREGILAGYLKTREELLMEYGLPETEAPPTRWSRLTAWVGAQFDRLLEAIHEAIDPNPEV